VCVNSERRAPKGDSIYDGVRGKVSSSGRKIKLFQGSGPQGCLGRTGEDHAREAVLGRERVWGLCIEAACFVCRGKYTNGISFQRVAVVKNKRERKVQFNRRRPHASTSNRRGARCINLTHLGRNSLIKLRSGDVACRGANLIQGELRCIGL